VSRVRVAALEKRFASARSSVAALRGFSLDVPERACVAILGPSGCGKTTFLRVVAGLERPDAGRVYFGERDVTAIAPERRGTGMVFQNDALFTHRDVRANIAYGLHGRGLAAASIEARVHEVARLLHVDAFLDRPARSLSGGERQRVAVARALAPSPAVLLLDEPFSRLDAPLRAELRLALAAVLREARTTAILVTHDQAEAMALADTIAVVREGRVEQSGSPRTIYDAPASIYVASFVGSPAMSFIAAGEAPFMGRFGAATHLGFRADAIRLCAERDADVRGIVRTIEDLGSDAYVYVETALGPLVSRATCVPPPLGSQVAIRFERTAVHAFDAQGARVEDAVRV
jgi:ABC-type sugar transport system ATPase subunit